MAEAIASAIATAVTAAGGTITATQAITAAYAVIAATASITATVQARKRAEQKARNAYNAGLKDRYLMVRDALTPRTIVLGRQRVSGPMVFAGSWGVHNEHLAFVLPVAGHEVDGFEGFYWGAERLDVDSGGNVLGIRREEVFSISVASNTYTLQGKAKAGSVQARARYGGEVDTLTASLATDGVTVTVSGARAGSTGQLTISYNPDPDPFYTAKKISRRQAYTATGSSQTVSLSPAPIGGTTVWATYLQAGQEQTLGVTQSGSNITFTAPAGAQVYVTWQAFDATLQRLQIRTYTGGPGQVADAGLISALPGVWTSSHRFTRTAYIVVEATYSEEAFPGGIENVSVVVRGLKPYDSRTNRLSAYALAEGAVAGTPGTLPTGWSVEALPAGVSYEVTSSGTDAVLGLPYVDIRVSGSHTSGSTQFFRLNVPQPSLGTGATDGQSFAARVRLRSQSGAWVYTTDSRLQILAYSADGSTLSEVAFAPISAAPAGLPLQCVGTISFPAAARAVLRVRLGIASGQSVTHVVRVMLPQLWVGNFGSANDPETWTENPPLLGRGYAVHPFGGRLPWAEVDHEEIRVGANVCDGATTYTVGGADYESPLYRLGYVARTDQMPTQVLDDICQAMNGQWVYAAGKLRLMAGYYRPPTVTLDESWLIGNQPISGAGRLPMREHVNAFDGSFVDEAQNWQNVPYTKVAPQAYLDADRDEFLSTEDFAGIPWHGQVQYVTACRLRRARQGYTLQLRCNWRALRLEAGDVVNVSLAVIGAVAKPFEVLEEPTFEVDGGIILSLRETSPTIWDIDAGFPAIDFAPNTNLPDPWKLPDVESFDAFSGSATLLLQQDGTVVPRFSCEWDAITDPRVTDTGFVEIRWGAMRDPVDQWQTRRFPGGDVQAYLDGLVEGQYYAIEARTIGSLSQGEWTPQIRRLATSKEAPPGNVAGLTASVSLGQVDIAWTRNTEPDYLHTELRYGGTSWETATFLWQGAASRWAWPRPANGTYVIRAKHVDRSRNPSTGTASATVTVGDSIDGPAAVEIRLSRSTITIKADTEGTISSYAGATATVDVFENGVDLTSSWTITRTDSAAVDSTLTGTTTRTLTITSLTADSGTVTLTFAKSGYATQTRTVAVERLDVLTPIGVVSNLSMSAEDIALDPDNATAGVRFNRNGSISVRNTVSGGAYVTSARRWTTSTSATIGDSHYIRFTQIAGDAPTLGTLNTWQQMNTDRVLQLSETIANAVAQGTYGVAIATTPGGDSLGSGTLSLTAAVEPNT